MVARGRHHSVSALLGLALLAMAASACNESPPDNTTLHADATSGRADEVTARGRVVDILADSGGADRAHERFRIDVGQGLVVEIDHNLELARRVPVRVGDTVTVHGQFEPDPGHPVIHYTHHRTGRHEGGWIERDGERYE